MLDDYNPEKKHRPIETITAELTEVDDKIARLTRVRDTLLREHEEAAAEKIPTCF